MPAALRQLKALLKISRSLGGRSISILAPCPSNPTVHEGLFALRCTNRAISYASRGHPIIRLRVARQGSTVEMHGPPVDCHSMTDYYHSKPRRRISLHGIDRPFAESTLERSEGSGRQTIKAAVTGY